MSEREAIYDSLRIARLASTGRLATACALYLHRLAADDRRDAAGDITRQLLTVGTRPMNDVTSAIDLGELVEEMRGLLGILAGPGAIVVLVRDAIRVKTLANRGDLEQLVLNLVDSPAVGEGSDAPRRLTITTGIDGDRAVLSVADDRASGGAHDEIAGTCAVCGAVPSVGLSLARAIAGAYRGTVTIVVGGADVEHRVSLPLAVA